MRRIQVLNKEIKSKGTRLLQDMMEEKVYYRYMGESRIDMTLSPVGREGTRYNSLKAQRFKEGR